MLTLIFYNIRLWLGFSLSNLRLAHDGTDDWCHVDSTQQGYIFCISPNPRRENEKCSKIGGNDYGGHFKGWNLVATMGREKMEATKGGNAFYAEYTLLYSYLNKIRALSLSNQDQAFHPSIDQEYFTYLFYKENSFQTSPLGGAFHFSSTQVYCYCSQDQGWNVSWIPNY